MNKNSTKEEKEIESYLRRISNFLEIIIVFLTIVSFVWVCEATGLIIKCGMCDKKVAKNSSSDYLGKHICNSCYEELVGDNPSYKSIFAAK